MESGGTEMRAQGGGCENRDGDAIGSQRSGGSGCPNQNNRLRLTSKGFGEPYIHYFAEN